MLDEGFGEESVGEETNGIPQKTRGGVLRFCVVIGNL